MARKHMQFLVLAGLLTVATCSSVYNSVQIVEPSKNDLMRQISTLDTNVTQDDFQFRISNKRNIPCILANMIINITVPYKAGNNIKNGSLSVSPHAKLNGICSDVKSGMSFTWKEKGDKKSKNNIITLTFINDHTDFSLFSVTAHIYLDSVNFPGSTEKKKVLDLVSDNDLRLFVAPVKNGLHKCANETTVQVGSSEILISNVSLIAFNKVNDFSMRKVKVCSAKTKNTKTFPYFLTNDKKEICTLAKMNISLTIPYSTQDSVVKKGIISVPDNATINGRCGTAQSPLILTWSESTKEQSAFATNNTENTVIIIFLKNNELTYVSGISFDIFADTKNFPGATQTRFSGQTPFTFEALPTPENGLYSCANEAVYFDNAVMNISNVLLVAFDAQKDFWEKTVVDCRTRFAPTENDFNYIVRDSDGVPCILANMNIAMKIKYKQAHNKTGTGIITVPSTINATGECEHLISSMRLTWSNDTILRTINFNIVRNSTTSFVNQVDADISLNGEEFPGVIHKNKVLYSVSIYYNTLFAADAYNGLYNCTKEHYVIPMTKNIEMHITNATFIAFNEDDDLSTKQSHSCSSVTDHY